MENKDALNDVVSVRGDSRECSRCLEMENKIAKANEKCQMLELDVQEKKNVIERLEGKIGFMELKRLKLEDEASVLTQRNEELETRFQDGERFIGKENGVDVVVDLTAAEDEGDKITKLMFENKVLECEKKKAECEIEGWKVKYNELQMQVVELRKRLLAENLKKGLDLPHMDSAKLNEKGGLNSAPASLLRTDEYNSMEDEDVAVSHPGDTPSKKCTSAVEMKRSQQLEFNVTYGRRVRKSLSFAEDKSPSKNFSPLTPAGRPPVDAIYVSDSDDNLDTPGLHQPDLDLTGRKVTFNSTDHGSGNAKLTSKAACTSSLEHKGEEDKVTCYNGSDSYPSTPKRRRVSKVVTSDSESDDKIPIGRLMGKNQGQHGSNSNLNSNSVCDTEFWDSIEEPKSRLRLMKQRNFADMGVSGKCTPEGNESNNISEVPTNESDEEIDLDDLGSEGESLGGFIVNSSDVSEGDISPEETSSRLENSSDNADYKEIMSGLRRESKRKIKWEFEADMLADFAKTPEICMKAVCALYRQQTSEEKSCKATLNLNGRGFNQCDAYRGSELAEFLTDGDTQSDVKKSAEELLNYNRNGIEICGALARRYSKQLFAIYQNKEDPFFRPP